ncbi:hypothetical protein V3H18_15760 [Methylocystis sp. 9N]|uniref:Sulfur globule protein n=1 Tax=Methylocystis borbori TaxID=3118750 RepID=A0ABU7XNA4_9HYPH
MRKGLKMALTGALCGAVMATALPAEVLAGPTSAAKPDAVGLSSSVENVWYRRGWRGGYYRRGYNPGGAIAAGLGLGLLGAGLAASSGYYGGYPYYYGGYGYYPGYSYGGYYPYYNYNDWGWGW